jgi:hypothetical protein
MITTTYQLGWYVKRTLGPGRRAHVGTELFQHDQFDAVIAKTKSLLDEGFEVRILPLPTVKP